MATKSNGDFIPGAIAVPSYPNPSDNNVNAHPMNWAYEPSAEQNETPFEESEDL